MLYRASQESASLIKAFVANPSHGNRMATLVWIVITGVLGWKLRWLLAQRFLRHVAGADNSRQADS